MRPTQFLVAIILAGGALAHSEYSETSFKARFFAAQGQNRVVAAHVRHSVPIAEGKQRKRQDGVINDTMVAVDQKDSDPVQQAPEHPDTTTSVSSSSHLGATPLADPSPVAQQAPEAVQEGDQAAQDTPASEASIESVLISSPTSSPNPDPSTQELSTQDTPAVASPTSQSLSQQTNANSGIGLVEDTIVTALATEVNPPETDTENATDKAAAADPAKGIDTGAGVDIAEVDPAIEVDPAEEIEDEALDIENPEQDEVDVEDPEDEDVDPEDPEDDDPEAEDPEDDDPETEDPEDEEEDAEDDGVDGENTLIGDLLDGISTPEGQAIADLLLDNKKTKEENFEIGVTPDHADHTGCEGSSDPCCRWYFISQELTEYFVEADGQCNALARQAIRMGFHDAGTWSGKLAAAGQDNGGADGSLVLFGEVSRPENFGLEGVVGLAHQLYDKYNVSMADLVQYMSTHATVSCPLGPRVRTYVGRKDATKAAPDGLLPSVHAPAEDLIALFADKTISAHDLTALLGAHSTSTQKGVDGSKAGYPQDTTPGVWDVNFYNETLESYENDCIFKLESDVKLSQHPSMSGEWQKFVGDQHHWNEDYARAYLRLSLLGVKNINDLKECTLTLPAQKGTAPKGADISGNCQRPSSSSLISSSTVSVGLSLSMPVTATSLLDINSTSTTMSATPTASESAAISASDAASSILFESSTSITLSASSYDSRSIGSTFSRSSVAAMTTSTGYSSSLNVISSATSIRIPSSALPTTTSIMYGSSSILLSSSRSTSTSVAASSVTSRGSSRTTSAMTRRTSLTSKVTSSSRRLSTPSARSTSYLTRQSSSTISGRRSTSKSTYSNKPSTLSARSSTKTGVSSTRSASISSRKTTSTPKFTPKPTPKSTPKSTLGSTPKYIPHSTRRSTPHATPTSSCKPTSTPKASRTKITSSTRLAHTISSAKSASSCMRVTKTIHGTRTVSWSCRASSTSSSRRW
ncbi:hypothetical protein ACN47E_005507 [Coniothyrium glycines]